MGHPLAFDALAPTLAWLRADAPGLRIVLTNGHFDLLHVGHLDYLQRARALGDLLVVAVNDDASTRRLKGPGRPLVPAEERARLLAALTPVDFACVFEPPADGPERDTACAVVRLVQPAVYAKGGDYALAGVADAGTAAKRLPEQADAERVGASVVLIDYLPGRSTSALIAAVRALPG